MRTWCNCHVLFCFLSLMLLAAQVSVCKQRPSPFHSVAPLQLGAQLAIPILTFRGTPGAALPKTAQPPARCPHRSGHPRASQPSPARWRDSRLWKSHSPLRQGIARSQLRCGILLASVPRAPTSHAASLSSPGPEIIGKEGGKALHFHSPACAEPLGRNTSYLLPQSELQPKLGT